MGWKIQDNGEGVVRAVLEDVNHGVWTHLGPTTPDGFAPTFTNYDLPGGMPTTMYGDADFIATAWTVGWGSTLNGAFIYRVAGSDPTLILTTTGGYAGRYDGANWKELRHSLTTTSTDYWTGRQYGTDLFITNRTDGVYRWDGTTLIPIGAKSIATADESSGWSNNTADTTNYIEGAQSMYVASGNPGASALLTYNPTPVIDAKTGRLSAASYASSKSPGTDFYHFWVRFSNGAGATITAATTTLVITDTGAKTLTWDATKWRSAKTATAAAIPLNDNNWHEVWCYANDATEVATYDPSIIDKLEWKVTTSAGQTNMNIDDVYVVYATTMPAVQYLEEWKNMLWGGDGPSGSRDTLYFSKVQAPDQYSSTANFPIKAFGEKVTALKNFYNQLTIGSDNHVFTISGSTVGYTYPAYLFDTNEVTDEFGISSHRSVVKAKNRLWWWWQRQICSYNGTSVEKASYPVDVTLAGVDDAALWKIVGAPFRRLNQIWWTYERSGQSAADRTMRYDLVMDAWLPGTGLTTPLVLQTFVSDAETFLTFDAATRKVKQQGQTSSLAFSGTNIATTFEFPPIHLDGDTIEQVVMWLQYLTNTGTLTVQYRVADHARALAAAAYSTLESITQSAAGELGRIRIDDRYPWLQIQLTTSGVTSQIVLPVVLDAIRVGRPF